MYRSATTIRPLTGEWPWSSCYNAILSWETFCPSIHVDFGLLGHVPTSKYCCRPNAPPQCQWLQPAGQYVTPEQKTALEQLKENSPRGWTGIQSPQFSIWSTIAGIHLNKRDTERPHPNSQNQRIYCQCPLPRHHEPTSQPFGNTRGT